MSSKAKRPTLGEKLVRVKDLLGINRAWLVRIEALETRLAALEAKDKACS